MKIIFTIGIHTNPDWVPGIDISQETYIRLINKDSILIHFHHTISVKTHRKRIPISVGYMATGAITLPPLSLSAGELEALNLGIAIVAQAADAELASAAASLAGKIDAVLPQQVIAEADTWKFAVYPFADAARGLAQMPTLRAAIKARQKLRIDYRRIDGTASTRRRERLRSVREAFWFHRPESEHRRQSERP